jgi:hypothetical protein
MAKDDVTNSFTGDKALILPGGRADALRGGG